MKAKKILTASMSVALALTIASVTNKAWPSTTSYNIAKADFGETAASTETKTKLNDLINKIFEDKNLTNRYLGTSFFHKKSNFPYYHISFENHSVPAGIIDSTPWYNMWSEAATIKTKLDANTYTEKGAKHAIDKLNYYIQLYNFDTSHELKKDGFYTTKEFTTPSMIVSDGDGEQDFYIKAPKNSTENVKQLFQEGLVGIYKQGQEIEINLVANPEKVSKITGFSVNRVSTFEPSVEIGPNETKRNIVAFKVPGELKANQLVITNMKYIDNNGNEQNTGTFALDIDYSKATYTPESDGSNGIPNYRANLNDKIQKWIDRGRQVNEWLLTKGGSEDVDANNARREKISKAITSLENLKRDNDASYDKLYSIATPIHEEEDLATLYEVLDMKVAKLLESFSIYNEETYTSESIAAYKSYIESVPKLKHNKNIKELVSLISEFENSSFKYLKFNTKTLEKLIAIADKRTKDDYSPVTWEKFSLALSHAKDWLDQNNKYRPQINDTSELTTTLLTTMNSLRKTDGSLGEQVALPREEKKEEVKKNYTINGKFVERGEKEELKIWSTPLSSLIKNIEVVDKGNGKNELTITFGTILDSSGGIDKALLDLTYNKSGVIESVYGIERAPGRVGSNDISYITKAKLLVDADKSDINVDFTVADSYSLQGGKTSKYGDLLLDYSSKVDKESKKDPLKEQLQSKLDELNSGAYKENFKNLDSKFLSQLEQLKTQATTLLNKEVVTEDEVNSMINKLFDEKEKLSALANMKISLEAQKETYERYWKDNSEFTAASIKDVKAKLDKLEERINSLDVVDIEGEKELLTDADGEKREILVYKNIDSIVNELQSLGDYLRIDTTKLEKEVANAKEKLKDESKPLSSRRNLEALIAEVEKYINNAKLTPDDMNTDDQVNTNLTDYYTEALNFAISDLDNEVVAPETNKPDDSSNTNKPNAGDENKPTPETPTPGDSNTGTELPTPNNNATSINLTAAFNQFGTESPSMINSILTNATYTTVDGKNFIDLELRPLINSNNQPSSVLSKLTILENNNKERETIVLEEKEVTINYNGKNFTYKYPSKLRIPVEGKPTSINVNTFAGSPIFGNDSHINPATLNITYPATTNSAANANDLKTLFATTTSKYYDSWTAVFKKWAVEKDLSIIENFGKKVNAAQSVLNNQKASTEDITNAYNELQNARIQYDLLIRLRESNRQVVNNFTADKDSNKFTKESIDTVDKYLQGKIDRLEELLQKNPSSKEVETLFSDIDSYNNLLRYDTTNLEKIVKDAESKLTNSNLSEGDIAKLKFDISSAKEFIEKAKSTYAIQDIRKQLSDNLTSTIDKINNNVVPDDNNNVAPGDNNTVAPGNNNTVVPGDNNTVSPGNNNTVVPGDNNTVAPGDNNNVTPGDNNNVTPGDNNNVAPGDNNTVSPGDNNTVAPGDNNTVAPGDNNTVAPGDNNTVTPGDNNTVTPGDNNTVSPGDNNTVTPGDNNTVTPGDNNTVVPGDNNTVTPGDNNNVTPGDNNNVAPGDNNNVAPGDNNNVVPGDNNNVAPGDNNNVAPGDNNNVTPGNNNNVTPGDNNNVTPGNNNNVTPGDNNNTPASNKILNNTTNGVTVEITNQSPATKVTAEKIEDKELITNISKKLNLSKNDNLKILDLNLVDKDNKVVTTNEKRKVSITLENDIQAAKVFHIKQNNMLELINSTLKNNILTFEIDHFSKFAIISTKKETNTPPRRENNDFNYNLSNLNNNEEVNTPIFEQEISSPNANFFNQRSNNSSNISQNKGAMDLIKGGKLSRTTALINNYNLAICSIFSILSIITLVVIRKLRTK